MAGNQCIIGCRFEMLHIDDLHEVADAKASIYYPAKDMKAVLSHLYTRAAAQQDVKSNLAEFIVLSELEEKEPVPFNETALRALWKDYGNGHKLTEYILLMIYGGRMSGELFNAKKNMIR